VTQLFHRVNSLLPEGQALLTVEHTMPAADALRLMLRNNFSQVPVISGGRILGGFSFRSFSRGLLEMREERTDPLGLPVDEFIERFTIVDVTAELNSIFDGLDADSAVLVGRPDALIGIITGVDALHYLYELAERFVRLQEIEQAIRALIERAVTDEQLVECIGRSLGQLYTGREDRMPRTVIEMSFAEYRSVITDGRNWPLFEPLLGTERNRVGARLDRINDLRNDVFHFRRELTREDKQELTATRDWFLRKLQLADERDLENG
jgi:CBS domain-containing protein